MRRLGTPADIGNAVTLLCSNEAGWITGQLIAVDGGMGLMDPHCLSRFNSRSCRRRPCSSADRAFSTVKNAYCHGGPLELRT
jgi:hypothetical protein